jgi:hypothetical protein
MLLPTLEKLEHLLARPMIQVMLGGKRQQLSK